MARSSHLACCTHPDSHWCWENYLNCSSAVIQSSLPILNPCVSNWQSPFNNDLVFFFNPSLLMCNHRAGISMLIAWNCITQVWKRLLALPACVCSPPLLSDVVAPVLLWGPRTLRPFPIFFPLPDSPVMCTKPSPPASRLFLSWEISLTTAPSQTINAHYPPCSTAPCAIFTCCVMICRSGPCAVRHMLIFIYSFIFSLQPPYKKNSFLFLFLMIKVTSSRAGQQNDWVTDLQDVFSKGRRSMKDRRGS